MEKFSRVFGLQLHSSAMFQTNNFPMSNSTLNTLASWSSLPSRPQSTPTLVESFSVVPRSATFSRQFAPCCPFPFRRFLRHIWQQCEGAPVPRFCGRRLEDLAFKLECQLSTPRDPKRWLLGTIQVTGLLPYMRQCNIQAPKFGVWCKWLKTQRLQLKHLSMALATLHTSIPT